MTTVDQLLLQIVNYSKPAIEDQIGKRDSRILRSLAAAIIATSFITENQSRLLVKILRENQEKFTIFKDELSLVLSAPMWTHPFRIVEQTKKLYISNINDSLVLTMEVTFSSQIRKEMAELGKQVSGLGLVADGKFYHAELSEKNIVILVNRLTKLNFEIDEKVQNYFNIIETWDETEVRDRFRIDTITHTNFQKQITIDLGINTEIDKNVINDRSIRYQYFTEKSEKIPENLTEEIAMRSSRQVWVDKNKTSLDEIFSSLRHLKRFPVMVIFDINDQKKSVEELENLSKVLKKHEIVKDVGIYFRLGSTGVGKEFNQLIADEKYNSQLDQLTQVVGIANGKIPKFLLKTDWKPMSVISVGRILQHNKTSVYTNCCDLIINWSDNQPIVENRIL
jgi:hypothetical protein